MNELELLEICQVATIKLEPDPILSSSAAGHTIFTVRHISLEHFTYYSSFNRSSY